MGWPCLACVALPLISLGNLMFPFIKSAKKSSREFPIKLSKENSPVMSVLRRTMSVQKFSHRMNIPSQRYKDTRQVENKFLDVILAFLSTALKFQLARQSNNPAE